MSYNKKIKVEPVEAMNKQIFPFVQQKLFHICLRLTYMKNFFLLLRYTKETYFLCLLKKKKGKCVSVLGNNYVYICLQLYVGGNEEKDDDSKEGLFEH